MELELQQSPLGGWETVCRTTLEQEETAEAIVPDARPDIWQVLDGQARLLLQRKEAQEGRGEVAGLLKVTVLYQPEGSQGVETMEVTLPFSAAPELPKLTRRGALHAVPRSCPSSAFRNSPCSFNNFRPQSSTRHFTSLTSSSLAK